MTVENEAIRSNVPELSVSELAFSLKRTLEESYGRVRVRGELSRVKVVSSGHMYSDLKDENAVINLVCWKGTLSKLSVKPEEGLEVICTGRITTYPSRSNYQLVIDSMELAGEGALLKMLEERKKKLAAEGVFAPERKKDLPFLPDVIGVVTSPTGAVIRDIMHRLNDRFPRHVLLYPVLVQGDGAANQIAAAVRAFDALPAEGGTVPRPDVLIVARGGGSLEDLMAFNEENVVRAVAECSIPVISAVGHETDTTLIDFASDVRAPTPTGAAEMAVPMRLHLLAQIQEDGQRLLSGLNRFLSEKHHALEARAARLGDPARLLEVKTQALDNLSGRLGNGLEKVTERKAARLNELSAKFRHPQSLIDEKERMLSYHAESLQRTAPRLFRDSSQRLDSAKRMLESLSFKSVLARGFVVVRDEKGVPVTAAEQTRSGQNVQLQFRDEQFVGARIEGSPASNKVRKAGESSDTQGQLF